MNISITPTAALDASCNSVGGCTVERRPLGFGKTVCIVLAATVLALVALQPASQAVTGAPGHAHAASDGLRQPASQARSATEDLYDCDDFDRFGSTRWNHAQDQYIADLRAYRADVNGLDGDRNGYACEDKAQLTTAPGQPGCFRRWLSQPWKSDCSGRDFYRAIYWLTSREDDAAIRAALLDVFGAQATKYSFIRDALAEAYASVGTASTNDCMRSVMLDWVVALTEVKQMSGAFLDMLGTGKKATKEVLKRGLRMTVLNILGVYTWAAGKVLEAAVELVSADKARTLLYLIASC